MGMATESQGKGLGYSQKQTVFATRIMNCVSRAFRSIGTGPAMEDMIFLNLSNVQGLGLNEIIDKPVRFIEGMKAVFGEAGVSVFEYKLVKEVEREFNLVRTPGQEALKRRNAGEHFQAAAGAAWLSI